MRDWIAFWNSPHSIYVNDRHRDVHYRTIAEDLRRHVPAADAVVLDYGCGEALHAGMVAAASGRLILCDAAPAVLERLGHRFADEPRILVRSPAEVEALPDGSLDLMVLNSVVQYLTPAQFDATLALAARLLRPGGRLVVGDVVPPTVSPLGDAWSLLTFAARERFLLAALAGLARTLLSPYRRLRASLGLGVYDPAAMQRRLAAAGFSCERAAENIGHNRRRMTFIARPVRPGEPVAGTAMARDADAPAGFPAPAAA